VNNKAADEYIARGFVHQRSVTNGTGGEAGDESPCADSPRWKAITFAVEKQDDEFGRKTALRHPINQGPFYAIRIAPGVHHTMGGVVINTDTCVLDASEQPLSAAHVRQVKWPVGIHGANRIGGNAVADIIIFGILAGRNAAIHALR
jgi:fumarate reductase flavoprotein subunit